VVHVTFALDSPLSPPGSGGSKAPLVLPRTYEQGLAFLDGRRRFLAGREAARQLQSPLLPYYE
jgi:hypothetical protein